MPLQQTSGAASYDAFGGGAPVAAKYIEDFFQTWLRTGTGSSTTVTTGLNASINKSLVWTKSRSAATNHKLTDTARGVTKALSSNTTGAEVTDSQGLTAFSSTGYTIGTNTDYNNSGTTYVDWQWVATPKFFDVVTYTGNGSNRTIAHNLGSVPGAIIIKRTDAADNWIVYHRSLGNDYQLFLNLTSAKNYTNEFNFTNPTSTVFSVNGNDAVNANGGTYVAYLFAHDAGGFGSSGTDNVISCGSYTGNGTSLGPVVNLGYEPQWLLVKDSNNNNNWIIVDNMRGFIVNPGGDNCQQLEPNSTTAEFPAQRFVPNSTGFQATLADSSVNGNGFTYIYIAIRRGPMKTPTSGTSVFTPTTYTGNGTSQTESAGFPTDMAIITNRGSGGGYERNVGDRLRGGNRTLFTTLTVAENTATNRITAFNNMIGVSVGSDADVNGSSGSQIAWNFRRAPGFFDEVCYTGTGSATTQAHNLGVAPEMMIVKRRNSATYGDWYVYAASQGATKFLLLNLTDAVATNSGPWNNTAPTSSVFTAGSDLSINTATYVAYLFASVAGVSKVGSYTGTGTTKQIDCGFTGGARFVLIKRTDSTGDWYVWDSARGIVAGNDPYLLLNSTAAEVTNTDYIDTYSAGFEISSTAPAAINANGGTFIFLAIA